MAQLDFTRQLVFGDLINWIFVLLTINAYVLRTNNATIVVVQNCYVYIRNNQGMK